MTATRRHILAAGAGLLAAPALLGTARAQRQPGTLRFVPEFDLPSIDPIVNTALPTNQQLFLGEGNNGVDSKVILGEGTTAVQQTIAGLGSNNTDPDCRIVGGASTNSTLTLNLSGNVTFTRPFGGGGTNENNLQLVKSGVGTLTLSTNNSTHTGTTTVNGGALLVNSTITSSPFIAAAGELNPPAVL